MREWMDERTCILVPFCQMVCSFEIQISVYGCGRGRGRGTNPIVMLDRLRDEGVDEEREFLFRGRHFFISFSIGIPPFFLSPSSLLSFRSFSSWNWQQKADR